MESQALKQSDLGPWVTLTRNTVLSQVTGMRGLGPKPWEELGHRKQLLPELLPFSAGDKKGRNGI